MGVYPSGRNRRQGERTRLQRDLAGLRSKQASAGGAGERAASLTAESFLLAARAYDWFLAGDVETKRAILGAVGSNLVLRDRTLSIEAKTPFRLVAEGLVAVQRDSS